MGCTEGCHEAAFKGELVPDVEKEVVAKWLHKTFGNTAKHGIGLDRVVGLEEWGNLFGEVARQPTLMSGDLVPQAGFKIG